MKIAIDLRPLMAGKVSGVEVYIKSMLEALFELKSKHTFVLWYNAFKEVDMSHFPKIPKNVKLVRTRIPNKLFNLSLSLLRWPKLDKLIGEGIDVLWVPDPRPAPVSKKCKKIITFHDLSFEDFKYAFNWKTRLWHKILRPKTEAMEADSIIAVSQFTKSQLIGEYGIENSKIKVIYEAAGGHLKPLDLPKGFELIKRKYDLPDSYFLCLSTLEPRKNTAGIIEAYLAWQEDTKVNVGLVIAGKKHPKIFSETKLKKHPNIHLAGFIDEEDKALLYQHALAFLYPSFYEGFGLPILEAMQCGTPVITSDATAMPEVAGDAAILVNSGEQKEIKDAMHEICRDKQLRNKLIEKGFAQAKNFAWKKAAEELLKSLENVKKNSN
ncbi:glycosyltransferase family 4 protein [Patescibacteria group bacterium]|nr:glycosyltransferase family 4 protein [Patescibacteria group bacterium]MBU1015585.1 glycosyltransferase family 4 protein [Patescibacteria group bacterium]MBU1685533.1 glycosyltransferase family 4 protein [Patescibacteria group bacterium]